jgi:DNA-directed RNA polymerase specialized sigma24 family protein
MPDDDEAFSALVREVGPRLKQALIASLGGEAGREAAAEALAWGWEHRDRLRGMANPAGYLYRVGRSRGSQLLRRRPSYPPPDSPADGMPWVEPGLPDALSQLSEAQRVAVLLLHGFGWTYREVAVYLGVSAGTVQKHAARGMARLRHELKVEIHA